MKTQALFELRDHAEGKLWPFPDRMQHLHGTDTDFNTESFTLYFNIELAFRELQDNITAICTKDEAISYANNVIGSLRKARYQVNQFFTGDNEYNKKLQQIETEGLSESPGSGLTPADSIFEDKLEYPAEAVALYVNKICLWGEYLFTTEFITDINDKGIEDLPPTKVEQVMLIHYTKLYSYLYKEYNSNHTTVSKIIAAIIGGEPSSINRIRNFISNPAKDHRNNPFKNSEIIKSIRQKLTVLGIDTAEFEKDFLRSKKPS